ncbi:hypothetical protein HHK36_002122 [Tetracentron sinense]|uniref:Cellulose synthase-like protein H1 n=1 Tax=Tetracentron sinense TaxID=13715 RepID=A0A835DSP5_TETSI|nr:hypothetical protein HHK36_002122 [Tetracentron sinense]
MASPIFLPLQEKVPRKNTLQRASELTIFYLLLSFLLYRLLSLNDHGVPWLLAFLCESWFTFVWFLSINIKWNLVDHKTYPERLLQRVPELPPVDMFVTTADPVLEPPIITVNTVLSLLAVDYPTHKLACYVSDDGGSPLTFYSLVETAKFAKLWVPFCKKYDIQVRAPFHYFSSELNSSSDLSSDLLRDWREMKVIWENKDNLLNGVPLLVYVSREKQPKHPHHFKAGAMNVLTRVSGVITNAPFMLNVDCDLFANNPQIVLHAMCLLLGSDKEREYAFVQCPQHIYGGLKDDPFGNQMIVLQEYLARGIGGIQGPFYGGTGCFHRRKVIYGLSPVEAGIRGRNLSSDNRKSNVEVLQTKFGKSTVFTKSAAQILSGITGKTDDSHDLSRSLEAANQVAGCNYEYGTYWGTKIGWVYGSMTEDVLTGLGIHARGWGSVFCTPEPPPFLGCAPMGGPACMTQLKRWATGLLEILFSKNSPILATLTAKLQFRQCLCYLYIVVWGLRSIPELCYAALPAYCILTNTYFIPKVSEPAIFKIGALFIIFNLYTLSEYLRCGLSIRTWWNNQRMARITSATAWLFGVLSVVLKLLGLSETVFEVTRKDQSTTDDGNDTDAGRFTFDESPVFVPATALVLVHLTALSMGLVGVQPSARGGYGSGLGEVICCAWVVLNFLPFVKGLVGKGKYGIPSSTL